jgi:hypothetical protein
MRIHDYKNDPKFYVILFLVENGLCMNIKPKLGAWSLELNVILIHLHG